MIDITMTINGRPATSANIHNELEKAVYESIRKQLTEKLRGIGSTVDGKRLKVELKGSSIHDLSVSLSGPEELVERAKKILDAK